MHAIAFLGGKAYAGDSQGGGLALLWGESAGFCARGGNLPRPGFPWGNGKGELKFSFQIPFLIALPPNFGRYPARAGDGGRVDQAFGKRAFNLLAKIASADHGS
jgi:hypothetical protein